MDPYASGTFRVDPDEVELIPSTTAVEPEPPPPLSRRRADVDAKQLQVAQQLAAMECEGVLLLMPWHVTWFTSGMNVRGLFADAERPGVFVNAQQRWLLCSITDVQRFFDEELDQLGFQVKEWAWDTGRADLLANVVQGRRVAADRPIGTLPLANDRLRPLIRVLSAFERDEYRDLGRVVAHALEATGRNIARGQTEEEVAGQLGYRLLHHGAEPVAISVAADDRGERYRRAGFTSAAIDRTCTLQATAQHGGLHVTASRSVSFGPPPDEFRGAFETAVKLAAVYRSLSRPDDTLGGAAAAGQVLLATTPYEYDWRLSQPGYGTGRLAAEELRRAGQEEPFAAGQAVVWQARVGAAAVVDTVLTADDGSDPITPPEDWPFKRAVLHGRVFDIPDVLVRNDGERGA